MFFTCAPTCTDSTHGHAPFRRYAAATKSVGTKAVATKLARTARGAAKQKSMRIDLHCHYHNMDVQAEVNPLNPGAKEFTAIYSNDLTREVNVKQMKDRGEMLTSIERRLKDMDKMGVDIQAISPAPFQYYYWAEPDQGARWHRKINERIAEICAKHPERFVGLGDVPLQNADLAVRELDYAVKELGLKGVEICTNVNGKNLTDATLGLEKFFRRCEELDIVVFMHPNGFSHAERLTNHYFNNVIGNPLETTIAVSHLIFDGVMERYPKLKFVLSHSGGYLAHYWARMDHAWRARPDCHTVAKKKPSSQLAKFYIDTITFDTEMLKRTIDKWGADHIVLGTDYPYDMGMFKPVEHVQSVPRLSAEDRDRILGGNAAKLLKIKPRR